MEHKNKKSKGEKNKNSYAFFVSAEQELLHVDKGVEKERRDQKNSNKAHEDALNNEELARYLIGGPR